MDHYSDDNRQTESNELAENSLLILILRHKILGVLDKNPASHSQSYMEPSMG
jgi:hypothetical protein